MTLFNNYKFFLLIIIGWNSCFFLYYIFSFYNIFSSLSLGQSQAWLTSTDLQVNWKHLATSLIWPDHRVTVIIIGRSKPTILCKHRCEDWKAHCLYWLSATPRVEVRRLENMKRRTSCRWEEIKGRNKWVEEVKGREIKLVWKFGKWKRNGSCSCDVGVCNKKCCLH